MLQSCDGMPSGRSIEQACRHLLRHLGDAHALAQNELIAPQRLDVAAVRRLLRAAAADILMRDGGPASPHAMRQHTILTRCDLMGEPHKCVAAECGLSMRQFYRERRTMIARLARLLAERFNDRAGGPAFALDVAALELARARFLQYAGYPECALVVLRSITEGSDDTATVVAAGCRFVSLLVERYEFNACRDRLDELHAYLVRRSGGAPPELETQRIACERRNLLWLSGGDADARELDRAAFPALLRLARSAYRPAQEFAAAALTDAGRRALFAGSLGEAQAAAHAADAALHAPEQTPPDIRIALLIFSGVLMAVQRGHRKATVSAFLDATTLAVKSGLSELAIVAALGLSIDDEMRGDAIMARNRVREVLPLALSIASPFCRARVHLRIAELAAAAGNDAEAQDALRCAEGCIAPGSVLCVKLGLIKALALAAGKTETATVVPSARILL